MDRNQDGVVTIEEFIESCQKVQIPLFFFWQFDITCMKSFSFRANLWLRYCFHLHLFVFFSQSKLIISEASNSIHPLLTYPSSLFNTSGWEHHAVHAAVWQCHLGGSTDWRGPGGLVVWTLCCPKDTHNWPPDPPASSLFFPQRHLTKNGAGL